MRIDLRALLRLPWRTLALTGVVAGLAVTCLYVALSGTRAAALLATPAKAPAELKISLAPNSAPTGLGAIQSQPLLHDTQQGGFPLSGASG